MHKRYPTGISTKTKLKQCAWVSAAGKTAEYRQKGLQGLTNPTSEPRTEVEVKLAAAGVPNQCLWIYYMPAEQFKDADLATENHVLPIPVPGTYEEPLTFADAEVEYGGKWENFVSDESGLAKNPPSTVQSQLPTQVYRSTSAGNVVGCQSYVPFWGNAYWFSTWERDESGRCAPWEAGT